MNERHQMSETRKQLLARHGDHAREFLDSLPDVPGTLIEVLNQAVAEYQQPGSERSGPVTDLADKIVQAAEQAIVDETCKCGHPAEAHDAGECWTYPDATDHPDPACGCWWYEPADEIEAGQ